MTVLPGMDEVGSLLWIADHHDSGDYDVVVVDAAPTGETLRLLSHAGGGPLVDGEGRAASAAGSPS